MKRLVLFSAGVFTGVLGNSLWKIARDIPTTKRSTLYDEYSEDYDLLDDEKINSSEWERRLAESVIRQTSELLNNIAKQLRRRDTPDSPSKKD